MLQIPITQLTALSLEHPNLPITRTNDEIVTYRGIVGISFTISRDYKLIDLVLHLSALGYFKAGTLPLPNGLRAGEAREFAVDGMWYRSMPLQGIDLLAGMSGAQIRLVMLTSNRGPEYQLLPTRLRQLDHGGEFVATADATLEVDLRLCHEL